MDSWQFLKDYGGHALGFLGLAHVWVIALWRRFVSRGRLTVYETAAIEIGFSSFGPTVDLLGTLRAVGKDVFVQRMSVRVVRAHDRAEHTFTWRAFRPSTVTVGAGAPLALEVAGSFLVSAAAPRQYNVFFASAVFAAQYEPHIQPLRDAWRAFLEGQLRQANLNPAEHLARLLGNPELLAGQFAQFLQAGNATGLHAAISNGFFWHAGDYRLDFMIDTHAKAEAISRHWRFALSAQDEQSLRLNVVTLIRELCYLPVVYNFAHKEYVEA